MENVDPKETQKFDSLADRWWDPKGDFKPLHDLNPSRLSYIQEFCDLSGKRVLDVGCGGGLLTEAMAQARAEVTGIDAALQPLEVAKKHSQLTGLEINYEHTTAEKYLETHKDPEQRFDVVTCLEMLEHVPDPALTIRTCAQLVKPLGHLYFSTINRTLKAYLLGVLGAEYVFKLLPKGTHDYKRFIKPSELDAWCREARVHIDDIRGIHYNPILGESHLKKDIKINYIVHAIKK